MTNPHTIEYDPVSLAGIDWDAFTVIDIDDNAELTVTFTADEVAELHAAAATLGNLLAKLDGIHAKGHGGRVHTAPEVHITRDA